MHTSLFRSTFSAKHATEFKAIEDTLSYLKERHEDELYDYIYSLYYHTRVTVAKKILTSVKWTQYFKFNKFVSSFL